MAEKTLRDRVEEVLSEVRLSLVADGGNVELIEVTEDGVVKVRLTGACNRCPMATLTLKIGIESYLKKKIPEVKSVEAV